jgi:hypothetical protein
MTLIGSAFLVLRTADLLGLTRVTLISTAALCVSGLAWLMYGQRFETPRARLALIALTVVSIAVLTLLAWAQNGPLKDTYLSNIRLVEAVGWWGILPLVPLSVAWRLLAGSLQKLLPIDSVGAWTLLAFFALLLPLAAYPGFPQSATVDEIVLAPTTPWIVPVLLGWMFRWRPLGVAPRVASMVASFAWGLVGTWGAFGLLLYGGFRGE